MRSLALCRGLDFAVPKHVSAIDVKASFEKAFWKLEPHIPEHLRDLTASTLRSVALNYIHRKGNWRDRHGAYTLRLTVQQNLDFSAKCFNQSSSISTVLAVLALG